MIERGLKPGERVQFIGYQVDVELDKEQTTSKVSLVGTIVEEVPEQGGYMVLPDGCDQAGGFGYSELEKYRPSFWEKIVKAHDDFG